MKVIAASELRRHGVAVIEKLLRHGPVHVTKRNRPVCVVLAEDQYERLTTAAKKEATAQYTVMEWLALNSPGTATKEEVDKRLTAERDEWDKP